MTDASVEGHELEGTTIAEHRTDRVITIESDMPTKPSPAPQPGPPETAPSAESASRRNASMATGSTTTTPSSRTRRAPVSQDTAKKTSTSRSAKTRDPQGGLTAAGRRAFADKDGSHLKPGVTKPASEMSPDEMRRKGSWAARFYGRATLPPLVDEHGQPTRFALSAHAWGEKVPKTEADARKIAEKGRRLLARAAKTAAKKTAPRKRP